MNLKGLKMTSPISDFPEHLGHYVWSLSQFALGWSWVFLQYQPGLSEEGEKLWEDKHLLVQRFWTTFLPSPIPLLNRGRCSTGTADRLSAVAVPGNRGGHNDLPRLYMSWGPSWRLPYSFISLILWTWPCFHHGMWVALPSWGVLTFLQPLPPVCIPAFMQRWANCSTIRCCGMSSCLDP